MAHVQKFTKAAAGHMFKHYERAKDENGEYVQFSNQCIDTLKSYMNYNLAPKHGLSQGDFVKKRCTSDGVKCFNRKDVNVMCSWIVTAPKDLPEDKNDLFFEQAYKFLSKRYGEENVISAYVHLDETTPHIHFAFVPVVEDKKKGGLKVSAKEAVDKKDLITFHKDLSAHMIAAFGYDIGIENGKTKLGNQTVEQLKAGTEVLNALNTAVDELATEYENMQSQVFEMDSEIQELQNTIADISEKEKLATEKEKVLDKKLSETERYAGMLREIENPAGLKYRSGGMFGGVPKVELNAEAFELIQNWALENIKHMNKADKLQREVKDLERKYSRDYVSRKSYDELLEKCNAKDNLIKEVNAVLDENPMLKNNFFACLNQRRAEIAAREARECEEREREKAVKKAMKKKSYCR